MIDDRELDNLYSKYRHLVCQAELSREKETHQLRDVLFEMTQACNMRCEHCCVSAEHTPPVEEIDGKYFIKVIDEITAAYGPGSVGIGYTGGEPLLRKDFLDIAEYAYKLGFTQSLTTNGTLITDKIIEKLAEYKFCAICISIDGLEKTHEEFRKLPGCYQKLLKTMRKIKEANIPLGVTTVVNKRNIGELEEMYKQFCEIGLDIWRVIGLDPIGRAQENSNLYLEKEDFERMFDFIEEKQKEGRMLVTYTCSHFLGYERERRVRNGGCYKCVTGVHVAYILSNGDIFGCSNMMERRPELVQGNVKDDNFVDVWENRFQIYRDPNVRKNEKCAKCEYWRDCRGDAMHTYDFDAKRPMVCMKDILKF